MGESLSVTKVSLTVASADRTMLMELMGKSKSSIYEARTQWQRQVVKFWFLDAAATPGGSDYATSILGMESELTITEFIPNDDDDEPQETGGLLKRPPYPALARQVVQQLEEMNEQPPESISDSRRSRAVQALEEYSLESARPPT
jgi:hypothetical protein